MTASTISIIHTITRKGKGTVLCVQLNDNEIVAVGDVVNLMRPDGSVLRSQVQAIDAIMDSNPITFAVMLLDDPGIIPVGSSLILKS